MSARTILPAAVAMMIVALALLAACAGPARHPVESDAPKSNAPANTPATQTPTEPEKPQEPARPVWTKRVVITTGVHGNEPSGWLVQEQLKELGFTVFGPCNPWGIKNNKRELEDGRDLNRFFQDDSIPQVKAVHDFLRANVPDLLLDLHEDPTGPRGPYLIQNGPKDKLAEEIIAALDEYAWDPEPAWGPMKGSKGIIKPTATVLAWQKYANVFSLAAYAYFTYNVTTLTVEVPGNWPEDKRKAYQLKVCQKAREILEARARK